MNARSFGSWRGFGLVLCGFALVFGSLASGCEKSPKQKLAKARLLLSNEKPDKALKLLKDVLKAQPENFDAKRRIAQAYAQRGEFKRAEQKLDKLWKERGFDGEDLSTREKNYKELMRSQYVSFYKDWAKELDPESKSETYVEVLKKGLDYNDRDLDLNMMLAEYYWKKGQRLEEKGNKKKAAEAYEEIRQLRTKRGWKKRSQARKKARDLRLEFFKAEGRKRFEKAGKKVISEIDGLELNEKGDTIVVDTVEEVPPALDPNNEKHAQKAKQIAFIGLINKLRKLTLAIAGLPQKTDLTMIGKERAKRILLKNLEIDQESMEFRRRRYQIKAKLPVEQAIGMAYDIKSAYEEAQEKKEKAEGGDEKGAGEGSSDEAEKGSGDSETSGGEKAGAKEKKNEESKE